MLLIAANISLLSHSAGQSLATTRDDAIQKVPKPLIRPRSCQAQSCDGTSRLCATESDDPGSLVPTNAGGRKEKSLALVSEHREAFGLLNPREELKLANEQQDREGNAHLTFT